MSIKNIYSDISSFGGIMQALHDVCEGNRYEQSELSFWGNCEENIHDIADQLSMLKYPPDKYRTFYVYEPKLREIVCSDFVTKLIHRSAYNIVNPLVCKTFIDDTYSCIKERGSHKAALRLKSWVDYVSQNKKEKWYYLKMDVEKFFYRINHEVLINIMGKKISDKKAMKMFEHYICEASKPFGLPLGVKNPMTIPDNEMLWDVGITIGGGLSHMQGNMYMDPLDQTVKRALKVHYYIRYMDDMVILSNDKEELHRLKREIETFLGDVLKLRLNEKTAIRPVSQGIEFVGFRIWPNRMVLRKETSLRMKRHLKSTMEEYRRREISFEQAREVFMSYKALLRYSDSKALEDKVTREFVLTHSTKEEIREEKELIDASVEENWYYLEDNNVRR